MKPLRSLNKRRRRAEAREVSDMFVTIIKRKVKGSDSILWGGELFDVQTGGMTFEIYNEAWKVRTKRSARYRKRLAQLRSVA